MTNKEANILLGFIYGNECMATGLKEDITFHHLVKRVDGGKATKENGARLQIDIHRWLHCACEHNDKELFCLVNECLDLYKQCREQGRKNLLKQYEEEVIPEFRKILSIK